MVVVAGVVAGLWYGPGLLYHRSAYAEIQRQVTPVIDSLTGALQAKDSVRAVDALLVLLRTEDEFGVFQVNGLNKFSMFVIVPPSSTLDRSSALECAQ